MKYKSYREQLKECVKNGIAQIFKLKKSEKIYVRPNSKCIEYLEIDEVMFCNKYMKRCTSGVCKKERGL